MTSSRRLRRRAWLSATAVLAAAMLTVATTPASADQFGILELEEVSGHGHDTQLVSFNGPGTPLLDEFFYRYTDSDHHLRYLASLPQPGELEVDFSDNNGDDEYDFRIAYQRVSPTGISQGSIHNECDGGACSRTISRPDRDVVFVITGFRFSFDSDDHHIDSIGIIEGDGLLTTWFDDRNDDDDYTVDVSYAWVPRSRFSAVGQISGTAHGELARHAVEARGEKVIRGFRVDNVESGESGDNHIKTFGVVTNSTYIDVLYGDDFAANSADWTYFVEFGALIQEVGKS